MNNENTIGARLRVLRDNAHITQSTLAEKIGLTQSSINRYENNNAEAPYDVLLWYADYFNVSLDYIYCRTDNTYGKYFKYNPKGDISKIEEKMEWDNFIEACFEEGTPMNKKLKEMMMDLVEEGKQ